MLVWAAKSSVEASHGSRRARAGSATAYSSSKSSPLTEEYSTRMLSNTKTSSGLSRALWEGLAS